LRRWAEEVGTIMETSLNTPARAESEIILGLVGDLPPLPQVASRVIALVDDPETSAQDVARVIASDQALTAKILRASNSAYYGRSGKISTLSQAVTLLGFQAMRNLVLVHSLPFGSASGGPGAVSLQKSLWEHSLSSALTARLIGLKVRFCDPEVAFVVGLLHDVGQMVFMMKTKKDFLSVVAEAKSSEESIIRIEKRRLGCEHARLGGMVLEKWKLPPELSQAVTAHHLPAGSTEKPELARLVSAASALAGSLGMGIGSAEKSAAELPGLLEGLQLDPESLKEVETRMMNTMQEERAMFNL